MVVHPKFVVDENQNRQAVLLSYEDWEKILEEIEELDEIRAYDEAKSRPSDPVTFDDAVKEIRKDNAPLTYEVFVERPAQRALARISQPC